MAYEIAFTLDVSSIKYGFGATREVGHDTKALGASRVMVATDPNLAGSEPVSVTLESLRSVGIDAVLFDRVHVEPTDESLKEAAEFANRGNFDGFVAVGGGSTIDTAKAANLYTTYPADFLDYVNTPIGLGLPVPGPLKPLIAIPTTAGTGSETTGVVIFDLLERRIKTGINHRALRPMMGIVDPNNTRTLPKMAVASCGMDVLCHALESLTALPFNTRPAPEHPGLRPAYQGANPISHIWASRAIEMVSQNILRVIDDPSDDGARGQMMLAATFAGVGFGNAGVHLAHGMSYPVSGMVRSFVPEGYSPGHPIIPHGMSVALNAPAVFQFTGPTNPELHLYAAQLMGVDTSGAKPEEAGELLVEALVDLMRKLGIPNGLSAVGYGLDDVDELVAGTLPQHRVTKLSPRPADAESLRQLFLDSLTCW
ncbi:MAG: iron-containing alcohol dehydrogenase [Armatimonadetes bacterium]|nr:iron-containing alcohol dehydrogenase [Armatimonadota bacterium]